jgi:hypothetical protein
VRVAIEHLPLVVVNDLDIEGISIPPHETEAPWVVDPDAVLTRPITAEALGMVPRRAPKIPQFACVAKHPELA